MARSRLILACASEPTTAARSLSCHMDNPRFLVGIWMLTGCKPVMSSCYEGDHFIIPVPALLIRDGPRLQVVKEASIETLEKSVDGRGRSRLSERVFVEGRCFRSGRSPRAGTRHGALSRDEMITACRGCGNRSAQTDQEAVTAEPAGPPVEARLAPSPSAGNKVRTRTNNTRPLMPDVRAVISCPIHTGPQAAPPTRPSTDVGHIRMDLDVRSGRA